VPLEPPCSRSDVAGRLPAFLYGGWQPDEAIRKGWYQPRCRLIGQIIAGKVRYPTYFDVLAKELLKNLLVGDLTKRYGNLRAGSSDIFAHGWFAEVDWDKLYRREIPAPYVPKIEGEGDASQ